MKIIIVRVANCHAHNLMFNNFRRQHSFNITLQVKNVWFTLITFTSILGITPVALRSDRHNPSQCTGNKTSLQSRDCWVNLCLVGTFGFTYKVAPLRCLEIYLASSMSPGLHLEAAAFLLRAESKSLEILLK